MFVIPDTINRFLEGLNINDRPIVVGVSGGADSLYLTLLLNEWAKKKKCSVIAVTVDHGLRLESAREAKSVHALLQKFGVKHTILQWKGVKPKTRVEELAREKRYELLLNFCKKKKATMLFLAHHQADQMETFLSRLARGSGLDGLTGMHPISMRQGILLIRPLLNTSKLDIVQALKSAQIPWVEDPMNEDISYERVRWRQISPNLAKIGLNANAVAVSAHRLQRAQQALDFYAKEFLLHCCQISNWGYVMIPKGSFEQLPFEIRVRVVMRLLMWMSPMTKVISLESVEKIALANPKHATLGGCQWVTSKEGIFIAQELKYMPKRLKIIAGKWTNWGHMRLWTNRSFTTFAGAPLVRLKDIPFLIQRTFPVVPKEFQVIALSDLTIKEQKGLEKSCKKGYKKHKQIVVIDLIKQKEKV